MHTDSAQKVLVVSSWAPPMIGGPQSLYNLFSQIPADRYIILTSRGAIGSGIAQGGTWLDGDYVFFDQPKSTKQQVSSQPPSPQPPATKKTGLVGFIKHIPGTSLLFYLWVTVRQIWLMTVHGIRSVRKNNCQLVLGISDTGPAMIATYIIAKLTRRPHMYYLYDIYRGNNLQSVERWIARTWEGRIMSTAERVIVTNEGTEQYYHRRYDQKIHTAVVHNAVFPETYDDRRTTFSPQSPYTILFTGHVYWAQEQAVLNLIQAMDKVQDLPVKLDLYIPKANEVITTAVAGKNNIRITAAPQSEMPRVQSGATLLFLPLAWNTKAPDIIATATPGKFTDYLASGRPMLVHAPDYAYVSQYAKQHELGIVVDTNSVEQLATAIRNYLKNPSDGQRYVDNALRIFHKNHDARKNAQKLTELLNMV